jgi:YhgE/Pip-like protein
MNTLRVLASRRVWGSVVGIVAVLALVFYAYLGAVVSPEENLQDLHIALVNEDRRGDLAGKDANLGGRVVERVTGSDSPAAGTVAWARPDTRGEALEGMGNGEYYGAIVIPRDYTQRISGLAGPPTIPIAVVVEDQGAEMNGQPVELGGEVAGRITSSDSPAPDFVQWARLDDRTAIKGLESGEYYAAIVIPKDLLAASGEPVRSADGCASFGAATCSRACRDRVVDEPGGKALCNGPDRERLHRHCRRGLGGDERTNIGRSLGARRARATGGRGCDIRPCERPGLRSRYPR